MEMTRTHCLMLGGGLLLAMCICLPWADDAYYNSPFLGDSLRFLSFPCCFVGSIVFAVGVWTPKRPILSALGAVVSFFASWVLFFVLFYIYGGGH